MYYDDLTREVYRLHDDLRALQREVATLQERHDQLETTIQHQQETILILGIFVAVLVLLVMIAYPIAALGLL